MLGMADGRKQRDWRKVFVVIALVCLPPLYVLSAGPAAWLFARQRITQQAYVTYVTPLATVRKICPPFHEAMNWYLSFWVEA